MVMDSNNNIEQKCFIDELSRLRGSSKSAVVSADFEDAYTMYMHVDRPVQVKFEEILKSTYSTNHSELILLCGSVGDGKSHMLSYCKKLYPELMNKFYVHNDSTASLYVDKPASYTLKTIMEPFSDENIDNSDSKVILAINLGTLSNFLDADTYNKFGKFKEYVEKTGILSGISELDYYDEHFHSVNFADYHLYELSEKGVSSDYIQGIIKKITQKTEDNVFYNSYRNYCLNCENASICPIKANYDLLSKESIQLGLISVLVESIVKNKLIISTRALLNFIYEILVDVRYFDRGSLDPRKEPERMSQIDYCNALLPNTLFNKTESSEIFDAVKKVDPMRIRKENVDDFFVYFENSSDVIDIFNDCFSEYMFLLEKVKKSNFAEAALYQVKESILRLYIRLCRLTDINNNLISIDETYNEYMKALYYWNVGDHKALKNIYNTVSKGVLSWNGHADNNEMQLKSGSGKSKYHIIQQIKIKPLPHIVDGEQESSLHSFKEEVLLDYRSGDFSNQEATLEVDYSLYKLLKNVVGGYIPSMNDIRINVKCVEFINRISKWGSKEDTLYIRDYSQKEKTEYTLLYEDGLGYSFEVE